VSIEELKRENEILKDALCMEQDRLSHARHHIQNAQDRIKRLEEALDLVVPHCSWVHHSKKHQHKYGEPCPVVALIKKTKESK
jgi:hypothetical protein